MIVTCMHGFLQCLYLGKRDVERLLFICLTCGDSDLGMQNVLLPGYYKYALLRLEEDVMFAVLQLQYVFSAISIKMSQYLHTKHGKP